jgi:ankyrin repeat protein
VVDWPNGQRGWTLFCLLFSYTMCFCNREMDQFLAANLGDLHLLKHLLTHDNVDDCDEYDMTVLHFAVQNGHLDCVLWCLEMQANVNAVDSDGWTPLYFASLYGYVNIFRVLLDAGASVDVRSNAGHTPLYHAISITRFDLAHALIDRGAKVSNVQLDGVVPIIPVWVTTFVAWRSTCRSVAITIVGIHKYHRTTITGNNDNNVMRLIGKHIWSMRMDDVWMAIPAVKRSTCNGSLWQSNDSSLNKL